MSIGPSGIPVSVAGLPLAQTTGSETDRTRQAIGAHRRQVYHEQKAAAAAGVGEPDGDDHQAGERDADGRRPWEEPPDAAAEQNAVSPPARRPKDPSRKSGNLLDLTG
ncbi:MAG: hypothetical protein ABFC96_15620 [Thermoguttaceae bacterium]